MPSLKSLMGKLRLFLILIFSRELTAVSRHSLSYPFSFLFYRVLKAAQRDRAAQYPYSSDPLTDEVASRLVDRLEDCTRSFPRALVLGGAGLQVLHALRGGRGGVESATLVDTSQGMLHRAQREWNSSPSENLNSGVADNDRNSVCPKAEFVLADPTKEVLPVDPGSFDVVISCLGLHWVNDVPVSTSKSYFAVLFCTPSSAFNLFLFFW